MGWFTRVLKWDGGNRRKNTFSFFVAVIVVIVVMVVIAVIAVIVAIVVIAVVAVVIVDVFFSCKFFSLFLLYFYPEQNMKMTKTKTKTKALIAYSMFLEWAGE